MHRRLSVLLVLAFLPLALTRDAAAQGVVHPFVFGLAPGGGKAVGIFGDVGFTQQSGFFQGQGGLEQRLGAEVQLRGPLTMVAQGGHLVSTSSGASRGSGQVELFWRSGALSAPVHVGLGVGGGVDYGGTGLALARLVVEASGPEQQFVGNVRLERVVGRSSARDGADVIVTMGYARQVARAVRVGLEAVAEDLEGLVERDEAEGGARLLLGPSIALGGSDDRWRVIATGGPVMRVTGSTVPVGVSTAYRELRSGLVTRLSVVYVP